MEKERLEGLILRHFEGDLSPEEFEEFERAIKDDPEAAKLLRRMADQHLLLTESVDRPLPVFSRPGLPLKWLAAAVLVVAAGIWLFQPFKQGEPVPEGVRLFELNRDAKPKRAGSVKPGIRYLARAGTLNLGEISLEFKAPTIFDVPGKEAGTEDRQVLNLYAGQILVNTPSGGERIAIRTPQGILKDMGTVFEVECDEKMEEEEMLGRMRRGALPTFIAATVLSGVVLWQSYAGEEKSLTPEMGRVDLSYDPSLGRIVDREGLAFIKPVLGRRWTLAREKMLLEEGDWVKTAARGAHAAELCMKDGSGIILGPGGLVELEKTDLLRLHRGDLEIRPAKDAQIRVEGPRGSLQMAGEPLCLRAREEGFEVLTGEPRWLKGYKDKTSTNALGELVANIDGRDTPLTIGYHKVMVDIRDQIARTVVEESFKNHTESVLEGVFYFPLPQDASISGFAMWIGDEVVEADIVEKERAREIFETILREKRDPGLLEWASGNIFKARVYPIPAHGEKRIRITYTQVLPKEGDTYRYFYALQSELLTKTPLRELQVDVKISSMETLAKVECPSHMARIQKTDHAAHVEFSAEEYTPARDFEVEVKTEPSEQNLVIIPHQRAEEGYFMVLLQAGGLEGRSGLVRDSKPLEFILVVDTSNSMTSSQIREQRLFLLSLLEALGEEDRFNLLAFDVTAQWAFGKPVPATAENRERAMALLEKRGALGWTDFDLAFREVSARAGKNTHVVYIGDGIPTTGDGDPAACAARLKRLYRGEGNFHAVAVGSTYELMVLRAIASLGQGSFYRVGSGRDAAQVAAELLSEIASPGMRDITLDWKGFRVARVYPETLPNLPAGRQQIILGRYLPEGKDLKGILKVNGIVEGQKITKEIPVSFAGAEKGNSFIPRFWARMHLDHLLEQGPDPEVKEQIIALSEDFQIMTPYTSFLVLESDADRERFGVKKRLRMRGGEEFFAEGREDANYEIARKQMLKALQWRQRIREEVLHLYQTLGWDLRAQALAAGERYGPAQGPGGSIWREYESPPRPVSGYSSESISASIQDESMWFEDFIPSHELNFHGGGKSEREGEILAGEELARLRQLGYIGDLPEEGIEAYDSLEPPGEEYLEEPAWDEPALEGMGTFWEEKYSAGLLSRRPQEKLGKPIFELPPSKPHSPFSKVFPLPQRPSKEFKGTWPFEIRQLLDRMNRRKGIAGIQGGIRITVATDWLDVRGQTIPGLRSSHLLSSSSWASRIQGNPGEIPFLRWLHDGKLGICDLGRLLGSQRKEEEGDACSFPSPFSRYFDDLEMSFQGYSPFLTREGERATLKLVCRNDKHFEVQITMDAERNCILEVLSFRKGKKVSSEIFSDFVQSAGMFLPQRIETRNQEGEVTSVTRVTLEELSRSAFEEAMESALGILSRTVLLHLSLPEVAEAKQNALDGKASFLDRWVLMNHFAATQQWDRVREHFAAFGDLTRGKEGLEWVRLSVHRSMGENEDARKLILSLGGELVQKNASASEEELASLGLFGLARDLYNQDCGILQSLERIEFLETVKPVFQNQDARLFPMKQWLSWKLACLEELQRVEEAFQLRKKLAADFPFDMGLQIKYAIALTQRGELDEAVAYLGKITEEREGWSGEETYTLRKHAAYLLYNAWRLVDYLAYTGKWLVQDTEHVDKLVFNLTLSALVMLDREMEADGYMETWLARGRGEKPAGIEDVQLQAALSHALGQGADLFTNRIEEKWLPVLVSLAREFSTSKSRSGIAGQILLHRGFMQTAEGLALREELYQKLAREKETLPPKVLSNIYRWTAGYTPKEEGLSRADLQEAIFSRWERERDAVRRNILESLVVSFNNTELTFKLQRKQVALADTEEERAKYAGMLFHLLAVQSWSEEREAELQSLISLVGFGETKKAFQIDAIQVFTRFISLTRVQHLIREIPGRNKLSRRALKSLEQDALMQAYGEAVVKLAAYEESGIDANLVPFVTIERLTLEVRLKRDAKRLVQELAALYQAIPEPQEEALLTPYNAILAQRSMLAYGYLAAKDEADPALGAELLKILDGEIAKETKKIDARLYKYRLLVALDRGDDLEVVLQKWAKDAAAIEGNRWRIPCGYIFAERGKLEEAVKVFESVKAVDELRVQEYQALANWLMVLNEKERSREARLRSFQVMDEWQIRSSLRTEMDRYRRRGDSIPGELDETVFFRFSTLLRKARRFSEPLDVLRRYYEATKDFRLLEALPESVIGQTAVKIYDFLHHVHPVIELIDDEATVDRIQKYLAELQESGITDVDRRALWLLEFLVERQAAQQVHAAEPHVDAALSALKSAFKGEWKEGEPVLMAGFLASAGGLVEPLRSEQLRQLRILHDNEKPRTQDRFEIARHRAKALWASEKGEDAIQVARAVLNEYREAQENGLLPEHAHKAVTTLSSYLESKGEFLAAEKLWREELSRDYNEKQRQWFAVQLYRFYTRALDKNGVCVSGGGKELYRAVQRELQEALARRTNEKHGRDLVKRLCAIYTEAHEQKIPEVGEDLRAFGFQVFPKILGMYNYRDGQIMVGYLADCFARILGYREALSLLITRAENEPSWIRRQGSAFFDFHSIDGFPEGGQVLIRKQGDFWSSHEHRVGQLRALAKEPLGDLEPRLLSLVLRELRKSLTDRNMRIHSIVHRSHRHFWKEKADDFFRVAMEVLEETRGSEESVRFIADYLYRGINRCGEAIEVLSQVFHRGALSHAGYQQLVEYLRDQNRLEELIPILEPPEGMVGKWPEDINSWTSLMRAYFKTHQKEKVERTREAADLHFHEKKQWHESVISQLAKICLETELYKFSIEYLAEAISLHGKAVGRPGQGDPTLSQYYSLLAQAHTGLGETAKAVDAAAGAIVAWGQKKRNREDAKKTLEEILDKAPDLTAFAKAFHKECGDTRLEKPIIRKALGTVFLRKMAFSDAIVHLEACVESGPFEPEVYQSLILAYDKSGEREKGTERLLSLARASAHQFELYKELGDRLEKEEQALQAERAYTTLAEMSAHESEGHAMLAKIREEHRQWDAGAEHWLRVSQIRSKEPAGYLNRVRCLIHAGKGKEAREILEDFLGKSWPARFGDVHDEARTLLKKIEND